MFHHKFVLNNKLRIKLFGRVLLAAVEFQRAFILLLLCHVSFGSEAILMLFLEHSVFCETSHSYFQTICNLLLRINQIIEYC